MPLKPSKLALLFVLLLAVSGCEQRSVDLETARSAVFKIQVTSSEPNFVEPWKRVAPSSSSGTGFYIGKDRILTNAHVIADASFITVLRDGASRPVPARVEFVAHDCDLALLVVDDPSIFKGSTPVTFGDMPKLRSPVSVIGFPMGGEQVSVTEGVVSRVSYRLYVHSGNSNHVLVQVDSAINPGNSGGPVVQGNSVVGVAFQTYTRAENTGYIIPTPIIRRFLKDIEDGHYDGHPDDGLTTGEWTMMNPSMMAFHGLTEKDGGVQVAHVAGWAPTAGKIEPGDILLAIEGVPIGVDGKINFFGERVDFRALFDLKQVGETCAFKLARDGKVLDVEVAVTPSKAHPEAMMIYAKHPKYFAWGGLVFTTLTRSYLRTWGDRWYKDAPLSLRYFDTYADFEPASSAVADLIVLAKRLPDSINAYATSDIYGVVTAVDGKKVASLAALAEALEQGSGEFAVIEFFGSDDPLVLSRQAVKSRNGEVAKKYGIDADRWLFGPEIDGAVSTVAAAAPKGGAKP